MKNLKNLLMILVVLFPVVAFAQANKGYRLPTGDLLKQGDMVKCGPGSLMGKEYAHIYIASENGQESLSADAAGSLMKVKSINEAENKVILEDGKNVAYTCEIKYAVINGEIIPMAQTKVTVTTDNVKVIGEPKPAVLNDAVIAKAANSVLHTMKSNGTISTGELAILNRAAKR